MDTGLYVENCLECYRTAYRILDLLNHFFWNGNLPVIEIGFSDRIPGRVCSPSYSEKAKKPLSPLILHRISKTKFFLLV